MNKVIVIGCVGNSATARKLAEMHPNSEILFFEKQEDVPLDIALQSYPREQLHTLKVLNTQPLIDTLKHFPKQTHKHPYKYHR